MPDSPDDDGSLRSRHRVLGRNEAFKKPEAVQLTQRLAVLNPILRPGTAKQTGLPQYTSLRLLSSFGVRESSRLP